MLYDQLDEIWYEKPFPLLPRIRCVLLTHTQACLALLSVLFRGDTNGPTKLRKIYVFMITVPLSTPVRIRRWFFVIVFVWTVSQTVTKFPASSKCVKVLKSKISDISSWIQAICILTMTGINFLQGAYTALFRHVLDKIPLHVLNTFAALLLSWRRWRGCRSAWTIQNILQPVCELNCVLSPKWVHYKFVGRKSSRSPRNNYQWTGDDSVKKLEDTYESNSAVHNPTHAK